MVLLPESRFHSKYWDSIDRPDNISWRIGPIIWARISSISVSNSDYISISNGVAPSKRQGPNAGIDQNTHACFLCDL